MEEKHGLALAGLLDVDELASHAHELALWNLAAYVGERPVGSAAGDEKSQSDEEQREEGEKDETHGGGVYTAPNAPSFVLALRFLLPASPRPALRRLVVLLLVFRRPGDAGAVEAVVSQAVVEGHGPFERPRGLAVLSQIA